MSSDEEFSEAGQPIYRHGERKQPFELAEGDPNRIALISDHISRHLGPVEMVLHEIVSDLIHIDLHWVKPTPERNFHTLVTSGMSDRPMTVPPGAENFQFAELMVCLPPNWPVSQEAFTDEMNYWPIRWLKILARFPHEYGTWVGMGHSIPNGDPPEPLAPLAEMCCWLLLPPLLAPMEFYQLQVNPHKSIHFYAIVPIFREEMELKLRSGTDALLDKFDEFEVTELIDLDRRNVCKKFFFF
ncbi:MAG: suppressor of fused domain protein [Blastocatellia bacterium]|nr:suppressor of fused domain protein [Blastocatellia bacterium]